MSGFSAAWLAVREPADHAARDAALSARLAGALDGRESLTIVDLGTGSGSNVRALAPLLPGPQHWLLIDNDPFLLARACASARALRDRDGRPVTAAQRLQDLAQPGWQQALAGADLVTMSALLDLVSADFLATLIDAARGATFHAALTVDGRMRCLPEDPLDEAVFAAFRHHMEGDKGFGPSLGARAPQLAASSLAVAGYTVERALADWRVGSGERALAMSLLDGWTKAARETGRVPEAELKRWARRRHMEAATGSLELLVGHVDLLAVPA